MLKPHGLSFQLHPVLDVFQRVERRIQEIALATDRVERREPSQPSRKARGRPSASCRRGDDRGLLRLPYREQWTHDLRFDDLHDPVAVGIVRTRLRGLSRSRPRSNSVPGINRSISDQSSTTSLSPVSTPARFSGNTLSSSNNPPLNHATASEPTRPPGYIVPNRSRARSENSSGRRLACSSIRVDMLSRISSMCPANMQDTSILGLRASISASQGSVVTPRRTAQRTTRGRGRPWNRLT